MLRRLWVTIAALAALAVAQRAHADASASALTRAEERLSARFAARGVAYPPTSVALVALKAEARLELWANAGSGSRFIRSYLVRATSGQLGPKLRQGDHQVPEGLYRLAALNPNSHYHLSLRLDYPNSSDQAHARSDGRTDLGGDIMIHGDSVSDGCVPIGDAAIEEVFALVERVGVENVSVIISPLDLRRVDAKAASARVQQRPAWLPELYAELTRSLQNLADRSGEKDGSDGALAAPAKRTHVAAPSCRPYDAEDCVQHCRSGDAASCARAGLLFADGRGIAPDTGKAWSLLRSACQSGDALGCGTLGRLVLDDDGERRDAERAAELARAACDGGDGHGCETLADLCSNRLIYASARLGCGAEEVARLRERAVATLHWDCRGWGAYDCSTLAAIYAPGDSATALRLATDSCQAGDPGGCDELGQLYEKQGDAARARVLYDRACGTGYAAACERTALADETRRLAVR